MNDVPQNNNPTPSEACDPEQFRHYTDDQLQSLDDAELAAIDHCADLLFQANDYLILKTAFGSIPAANRIHYPRLLRAVAKIAMVEGEFYQAQQWLHQLASIPPTHPDHQMFQISALLNLANIYLNTQRLELLLSTAQRAFKLATHPAQLAEATLLMGEFYLAQASKDALKYYREAFDYWEEAKLLSPGSTLYHYDVIRTLQRRAEAEITAGNIHNARQALKNVNGYIKDFTESLSGTQSEVVSWVWYRSGEIYQTLGYPREALECFDQAMQYMPDTDVRHIQILIQKARLYFVDFQDEKAAQAIQTAENLYTNSDVLQQEQINHINLLLAKAMEKFLQQNYTDAHRYADEALSAANSDTKGRLYHEAVIMRSFIVAGAATATREDLAAITATQKFFEDRNVLFEAALARIAFAWINALTEKNVAAIQEALIRCVHEADPYLNKVRHFYRFYQLSQQVLGQYWYSLSDKGSQKLHKMLEEHEKLLRVEGLKMSIYAFGDDASFGVHPVNAQTKPHQLFAYLLCVERATQNEILAHVWGAEMEADTLNREASLDKLRGTFRSTKKALLKQLGGEYIKYDYTTRLYYIDLSLIHFYDARMFEDACKSVAKQPDLAMQLQTQFHAKALYRGDFLRDFRMDVVEEFRFSYQCQYRELLSSMVKNARRLNDPRCESIQQELNLLLDSMGFGPYDD